MKRRVSAVLVGFALVVQGCYATKIVSVPMRITGAVVSAAPFVGNTAHDAIDSAAEMVDDLP